MKAVVLSDYGPAENFVVQDMPKPEPGPGEVLVKVAYAGLRWGDIMQRNGFPTRMRPTPFIGGQEASGTIVAVGSKVQGLAPGMRVMAMPMNGGFAEYVTVHASRALPVPDNVSLAQVLAYPVNMRTAYYAVYVWAKIQEGERVLLHAAAGGVGLLALQILKRRFNNVTVVALVGSDDKLALVKANGADHAINYKTTNYVEEVTRLLGAKASGFMSGGERGGGVDVSLNGVSGPTLDTDHQVIRKRGRWVIYGWAGGRGNLNTGAFGYDGITVMPFSSIAWNGTPEFDAGSEFIRDWLQVEKLIEPTIYPLDQVAQVERAMEQGQTTGKVVFEVAP